MTKFLPIAVVALCSFNTLVSKADEKPNYEFKNGELIIHSRKTNLQSSSSTPIKINKSKSIKVLVPTGSIIEAKTVQAVSFEFSNPQSTVITTKDLVFQNRVIVPKGTLFSGGAEENNNHKVAFDLRRMIFPDGSEYPISGNVRAWDEKDFLQAKYIPKKDRGKRVFSRTFGSITKDVLERSTDDTIIGGAVDDAGSNTVDEVEGAIEENQKTGFAVIEKDTRLKILIDDTN